MCESSCDHVGNMPGGLFRKAFLSWRKVFNWHMCRWLREECMARGGCCSRSCGCCEHKKDTPRLPGRFHCTEFCPCCLSTHGFSPSNGSLNIQDIDAKVEDDTLKFDVVCGKDLYSRRAYRAYIWGVDFINDITD